MKLDGYIRVSEVRGRSGDSFISPSVQRDKIERWASLHGHELGEVFEELDRSGGTVDRPMFQELLGRVERGDTDGVIVAKLDRFARSLAGALESLRRIEAAGGQLVSVEDSFDTTTPMGRFALQITLALAELEHARIRENWVTAQQRAVDRGVHITARVPAGYMRGPGRRLEADPAKAAAVVEAFRLRGDGVALHVIAAMLNERGVRTSYGGVWIGATVGRMFENRVYLGEARGQGGVVAAPGAHDALVTAAMFEAAQPRRRDTVARGGGSLLAGILRCAGCRYVMSKTGTKTAAGVDYGGRYRCRGEQTVGRCPAPTAVHDHIIEAFVVGRFLEMLDDPDDSPLLAVSTNVTLKPLRAAADRADAELAAWRDDQELLAVGRSVYLEGLQTRVRRRDVAHQALQAALADLEGARAFDHAVLLRDEFPHLPVAEQRELLASTIDCVFLRRGRGIAISDRAVVLWRGQGPVDLPRRALPQPIRSFRLEGDGDVAAGVAAPADLPVRRRERAARLRR